MFKPRQKTKYKCKHFLEGYCQLFNARCIDCGEYNARCKKKKRTQKQDLLKSFETKHGNAVPGQS